MNKILTTVITLIVATLLSVPSMTATGTDYSPADEAVVAPQFPGGEAAMYAFIARNMAYPAGAAEQGIQGRVVVNFEVKRTGEIGAVEVARSVSPELDREAIRVVKLLPRFIPGKINGVAADVWYSVPLSFKLQQQ